MSMSGSASIFLTTGRDFRDGRSSRPANGPGVMEEALARIVRGETPRLTVAGRTDAGVHARGQVAHVDLGAAAWAALPRRSTPGPRGSARRAPPGVLPTDIVVRRVTRAPEGFDARFSALERRYTYRVSDSLIPATPSPPRGPVGQTAARRLPPRGGLRRLTGLRDFAAFCRPREGATTIRTSQSSRGGGRSTVRRRPRRRDRQGGRVLPLHGPVLVGAVLAVGREGGTCAGSTRSRRQRQGPRASPSPPRTAWPSRR